MILCVITLFLAFFFIATLPPISSGLVAHGRYLPQRDGEGTTLFVGEGMNSSVAVTELANGVRNFHVSGKVEASSEPQDMRLQRMLGHIPALVHPNPKSVLIVGCGAGVTAGSFITHPGIERIVICEIEPLIPRVVATYFGKENYDVVQRPAESAGPKVEIVYDDARHFILTSKEKFDIITSDPIHPWVKGAATLYTREYFELVKQHLNPGGVVTQWVPLYESTLAVVKSEVATFFEAFPDGTIWSNDIEGEGYDVVLLGQLDNRVVDLDALDARMQQEDHRQVADSLEAVGLGSVPVLLATYAGRASDLRDWMAGAQINRDRNLRLQYLAGMGAHLYDGAGIYNDMLKHRKFPDEFFTGSDERKNAVREAQARTGGK